MNQFSIIIGFWLLTSLMDGSGKEKTVVYIDNEITVDGIISEGEWELNDFVNGLTNPWKDRDQDETRFKCFISKDRFYFYFNVIDTTIVMYDYEDEQTVKKEDRAELFFSPDKSLKQYYCIEIDPGGKVLDYSAKFYRKFLESWDFNTLVIGSEITSKGYIIEGSIDLSELKTLNIKNSFFMGVFRADFIKRQSDEVNWYSWVDPNTSKPDFHIRTALRKVRFKGKE
jgi:hypothetical protein